MADNDEKIIYTSKRWLILAVLVFLPFIGTLGTSIVNVALPTMCQDLHVSGADIQIVVISYMLAIVSTLLFFGRLADILGKTVIFNLGIVIFTFSSLICGLASNFIILLIFRIFQGIGVSMSMASNQGMIGEVFPKNERGTALGISSTFIALGTLCGPPLGGLIITYFDWHYIFFINVPFGIVATILALIILPKYQPKHEHIDFKGALLLGIGIIAVFYAFVYGRNIGYQQPQIWLPALGGIALFLLFIKEEKKIAQPIIDLSILKNKILTIGLICTTISHILIAGSNIIQPFYLQDALGLSPKISGFILMTFAIVLTVLSPITGKMTDKFGTEQLSLCGLLIMALGSFLMSTLSLDTSIPTICLFMALLGVGNALFMTPNNTLIITIAPHSQLGIVGSINAFARNLGNTLGVSIFTVLLYSFMSLQTGTKVSAYLPDQPNVFIFGLRWVYIIGGLLALTGAALTYLRIKTRKNNTPLPEVLTANSTN